MMNNDISSESDCEEISAAEILNSMEEMWLNEKFAPDILPHKLEIVECLYLQINEMEKNMCRLERNDIRRFAHELELTRIKYVASSYLRIRLLKIEYYFQDILDKEEIRNRSDSSICLTTAEKTFALTYKDILDKYLQNLFTFVPNYVFSITKENPIVPNLNSFVFFQSKRSIDGIVIVDDNLRNDLVDIRDNSKMFISYSNIAHLLENDNIKLI